MTENYHRKKFEEIVDVKMKNPQCRIWTKLETQKIINMLGYGPKQKEMSVQCKISIL